MMKKEFSKGLVAFSKLLPEYVLYGKTMLDYLRNEVTEFVTVNMNYDLFLIHPTAYPNIKPSPSTFKLEHTRPFFNDYSYCDSSNDVKRIQVACRVDRYGFALGNINTVYRPVEKTAGADKLSFMSAEDALVMVTAFNSTLTHGALVILVGAMFDEGKDPYKTIERLWIANEYVDMVKRVGAAIVSYHTLLAELTAIKAANSEDVIYKSK